MSALMSYRSAAAVLKELFPVDAGGRPETLRNCALKIGEELRNSAAIIPSAAASELAISLDSTFTRSCEQGERHLEVRVGNVETAAGARHVFAAVARTDTEIETVIRRCLKNAGRTGVTRLTAFTDGCPGLRNILAGVGVLDPPVLDWFHIAMRLQHVRQAARGLATRDRAQIEAKTVIVDEVERFRWRLWHGKVKNARAMIDQVRTLMRAFRGDPTRRMRPAASRQFWSALLGLDSYLTGQGAWLVNYGKRHRAGLRVGTSITEGAANHLVNRRMNKSQQMRWSRRGADMLLQVRSAIYNGSLHPALARLRAKDAPLDAELAMAA